MIQIPEDQWAVEVRAMDALLALVEIRRKIPKQIGGFNDEDQRAWEAMYMDALK